MGLYFMNKTIVNIQVQLLMLTDAFSSFVKKTRNVAVGSYDYEHIWFVRNGPTVF